MIWGTLWSTGSSSDGSDEAKRTIVAHDRGSIVARSLHDRGPIVPRSGLIYHEIESKITTRSTSTRFTINATIFPLNQTTKDGESRPRSTHDRGLIASGSWPNRGAIVAPLRQNWEPRRRQVKSPPRRHQSVPTTGSNGRNSRPNFPFNSMYFSSLFFNF